MISTPGSSSKSRRTASVLRLHISAISFTLQCRSLKAVGTGGCPMDVGEFRSRIACALSSKLVPFFIRFRTTKVLPSLLWDARRERFLERLVG
jgi:hypothetical protein